MKDSVTARKYASALFATAAEQNQVLACQQGLEEIARIARAKESLRGILTQPFIPATQKEQLVHAALGEYATPLLERFVNLLVVKHRFDLMPLIAKEFQDEVDRAQNIQAVQVRAAYAMTEAQQKTLQAKLETFLNAKVRMAVAVEPELIGGLIIQMKDRLLDQSLKTQLNKLKEVLAN